MTSMEEDAEKMHELSQQIFALEGSQEWNVLLGALILTMGRMVYQRLREEEAFEKRDWVIAGIIKGVDRVVLDAIEDPPPSVQ